MTESIAKFGDEDRLVGILNRPESSESKPAVLLFNAGVVHRVGAHRLNVRIARFLAKLGMASMRFDLSGLGDSRPSCEALGYEQQSITDINNAIDFLETDRVILVGMCSGADNAYRASIEDDRIVGIVLLDPYAYEGAGSQFNQFAERVSNPDRWLRKIKNMTGGKKSDEVEAGPAALTEDETPIADEMLQYAMDIDRNAPDAIEFGKHLQHVTGNGCKVLILYTAYVQDKIQHTSQFDNLFSQFDFGRNLDVSVLSHVDHTYTEKKAQVELLDNIEAWVSKHWPDTQ